MKAISVINLPAGVNQAKEIPKTDEQSLKGRLPARLGTSSIYFHPQRLNTHQFTSSVTERCCRAELCSTGFGKTKPRTNHSRASAWMNRACFSLEPSLPAQAQSIHGGLLGSILKYSPTAPIMPSFLFVSPSVEAVKPFLWDL